MTSVEVITITCITAMGERTMEPVSNVELCADGFFEELCIRIHRPMDIMLEFP